MYNDNKWKHRYMNMAKEAGSWSKDPSTKIGAVIIGDKGQPISNGYNGFPRGIQDSYERLNNRELKYKYTIHAELNAIFNAGLNGSKLEGSTLYVTGLPVCEICANAIIQVGIKKVVMDTSPSMSPRWEESCKNALEKFIEAGVEFEFI